MNKVLSFGIMIAIVMLAFAAGAGFERDNQRHATKAGRGGNAQAHGDGSVAVGGAGGDSQPGIVDSFGWPIVLQHRACHVQTFRLGEQNVVVTVCDGGSTGSTP